MNDEFQMDGDSRVSLKRLTNALLRRSWLTAAAAVFCALMAFFCIAPRCRASVMFYAGSASLVDTYDVLLDTEKALLEIGSSAGTALTAPQLRRMIRTERVEAAELFRVSITDTEPARMRRLAAAVGDVLPGQIAGIVDAQEAVVVDTEEAVVLSREINALMGALAGAFLGMLSIVIWELQDELLHGAEDIAALSSYPVLASVWDERDEREAFIRLRTRLKHLLPGSTGRVIGLCGAAEAEAEQIASRLALSLSRQGRRVLLIDCDLRQFSEGACHGGLAGFLSGKSGTDSLIRSCGIRDNERAFHVIAAGKNPPNPAELLSGRRMARLLKKLRTVYDDILLDLPPLGEVGDALTVAEHTDGMILTVCRGRCSRRALLSALEQLEAVDAPILGILEHKKNRT